MKAHFEMMAAYNAWANQRLLTAAAELDEAAYRADLGAFFHSVHGTLNHLIVADRIWLARFRGEPPPDLRLDQIVHEERDALAAARRALDAEIVAFVGGLTQARLGAEFAYRPVTRPGEVRQKLAPALAHFFNHQTHHRGQAHALMTRLTGAAPALDLIYFQREG